MVEYDFAQLRYMGHCSVLCYILLPFKKSNMYKENITAFVQ